MGGEILAIFGINRICRIPVGMDYGVIGRILSDRFGYCEIVSVVGRYGRYRENGIGSGKVHELSEVFSPANFYGARMEANYGLWGVVNEEFMKELVRGWRGEVYKNNEKMAGIIDKIEEDMVRLIDEAVVRSIV